MSEKHFNRKLPEKRLLQGLYVWKKNLSVDTWLLNILGTAFVNTHSRLFLRGAGGQASSWNSNSAAIVWQYHVVSVGPS